MKEKIASGNQRLQEAFNQESRVLHGGQGGKAFLELQVVRAQKQISQASQRGDKQAV